MASVTEDAEFVPERAIAGLQRWIDCYEKVKLMGSIFCGDVTLPGDISGNDKLMEAYEMGKQI